MKKVFVISGLVMAIAGCNSEHDYDKVTVKEGRKGSFDAQYVDNEDQSPLTGTIVGRAGEVELIRFAVEDGVINGPITKRSSKGNLLSEQNIVAGKQVGEQKTYCDDGSQVRALEIYDDLTIASTTYDCATSLILKEQAWLNQDHNKKFVGAQRTWALDSDGKRILVSAENFSATGEKDGVFETYFGNGELKQRSTYKDGVQEGIQETWTQYTDGSVQRTEKIEFVNGKYAERFTYKDTSFWPEGSVETHTVYKDANPGQYTLALTYRDDRVDSFAFQYFPETAQEKAVYSRLSDGTTRQTKEATLEEVTYLLKNVGVDSNAMRNKEGFPLIMAVNIVYWDALKSLGVDINAKDTTGKTLLANCTSGKHPLRSKCSLDDIAKLVEAETPSSDLFGNTPLINFCGQIESYEKREPEKTLAVFKQLVAKYDVNATNLRGRTALHECLRSTPYARNVRNLSYAKLLIEAGADRNKADITGVLPAHMLFITSLDVGGGIRVRSGEDLITEALEVGQGSSFDLKAPFPVYEKPLKQIFLEGGDVTTAMMLEKFGG